jgi:hypothetical protein
MSVLTDIKNHGTGDILIACMDGLSGFPDAVKAVCRDLKAVYSAVNAEAGQSAEKYKIRKRILIHIKLYSVSFIKISGFSVINAHLLCFQTLQAMIVLVQSF